MAGFRHVVMLRFVDDATDAQVAAVADELRALPDAIPELAGYVVGTDAGLSPDNESLVVVADFASQADYEVYRDHPAHRAVIAEHIRPILAGRHAVQHHT